MRSITVKLVLSFVLVILVGVGLVAVAANLGAKAEFSTYLERGPTVVRLDRAVAVLSSYYGQTGRWDDSQALVERLAYSQGGRFVVADNRGAVVADSSQQLIGRNISGQSLGEKSVVFAGGKEAGTVHFVPDDYTGGSWWSALRFPGWPAEKPAPDSSGAGAAATPGSMMGPGMMGQWTGPGMMGHMSPTDMDHMMEGWNSSSSVRGTSEEAYLSGVNGALWLGGLGAALAALAVGLFSARRITLPVRRLAAASSRIAGGDLSQRVQVGSKDEIGELALSFNSMAEALARNEEARRHMVTDIAHELRTPLAVLQGNLEGMLDGIVPMNKESVSVLHEETRLLSRLVSDLRDISLAEAGQLRLNTGPTDLPALMRRSASKMTAEALAKRVVLDVRSPGTFPMLELDADRISQVLGNLLSNALRHAPTGGLVLLALENITVNNGAWAQVSVADTGPGIAAGDLPHIFDRFYRADRSRSRHTGGSGLGLAIVKQLVEAHGGRVWAESTPGQGSTFFFTLPLRR